jgi:hypothetical protein
MPSAALFQKGFGLGEGQHLGPFLIRSASVQHVTKEEFELYEFPIKLELEWDSAKEKQPPSAASILSETLEREVAEPRIIPSEYGSPYECKFGKWRVKARTTQTSGSAAGETGVFTVISKGTGVRRRDIPTQAQEQRQKESKQDLPGIKEVQKALPGQRVIRSHFGTGSCSRCKQSIAVGEMIASEQAGKRGWMHIACSGFKRAAQTDSPAAEPARKQRRRSGTNAATAKPSPSGSPVSSASQLHLQQQPNLQPHHEEEPARISTQKTPGKRGLAQPTEEVRRSKRQRGISAV